MIEQSPIVKLLKQRPRRRVTLGTLFGIITLVLFVSYNAGFLSGKTTTPEATSSPQAQALIEAAQKENSELQKELISAKRNYEIQLEAQKSLNLQLIELQQKNTELTRDMALYQTLAKSPQSAQGLEIKSFQIFATDTPNTYRYLIILSKQVSPQKFVQGAVKMVIQGKIGTKHIELPVKYVDSTREDGLGFKFRHLQELAGELSFPPEFVPEGVHFSVIPDKDWPQFQRHFSWATDNPDVG
ncbi:MAG: hypothetical protein JSR17_12670 [Proteobacteria bacterium]|nr:hypothetical protein [Pseudomonadota bacterium]